MATETDKTKQAQTQQALPTVTLTIDGQELTVTKGTTVLAAAQANGIDIPNFCYHPKLKSVGSCRMCYVEIEGRRGLAVSCSTEAMDGQVVSTTSDAVKKGRRAILEFILANHPLDCPTCDKGGECDLQNLTFAHGLDTSRFDFLKNRFVDTGMTTTFDDIKIGPEIMLNRNRCILCYKCVRANKEAFGEFDLGAFERGNITQINSAPGQEVDNPFSGNLVEICPVGALTSSDWRYKVRVWLTETADSICPHTSTGTNIKLSYQKGRDKIFRATSRTNDQIDDGWIADVTRYGYQMVNSDERIKTPLIKKDGTQVEATWEEALALIEKRVTEIRKEKGSVCMGGLISPGLDNRTLHSFNKFIRKTIGSNNIDYRQNYHMLPLETDGNYVALASQKPSIADIDSSDLIVVFGSDLNREHPNEYLRIRKAVTTKSARFFSFNPYETKTADIAELEMIFTPGTEEVTLIAIGLAAIDENLIDQTLAEKFKANVTPSTLAEAATICGLTVENLKTVARALVESKKISVVGGELISNSTSREVIATALTNLNLLFGISSKGQIAILPMHANSRGAEALGLAPKLTSPVEEYLKTKWHGLPENIPCTADRMLRNMKKEELDGLFIMGANPAMLYPDRGFAKEGLDRLDFLVVCDLIETETTAMADVVLPLASWAEYRGDYVNLEGKNQTANQAIKPRFESRPGFEILWTISSILGEELFDSDQELDDEIKELLALKAENALPGEFTQLNYEAEPASEEYPVNLYVGNDSHHRGHLTEKCSSLDAFCGEAYVELSEQLAEKLNITEGAAVRVESEIGKIVLSAHISDFMSGDAIFIPHNFSSTPVTSLIMRKQRLYRVKISPVAD